MSIFKLNINDINDEDIGFIKANYPERYKKASSYKIKEDFLRSIGAGILLSKAYPEYKEEDMIYNEWGKPSLLNKEAFNISHSGDLVVLVKSEEMDELIGVDIEKKESKNLKIMYKVFSKEEINFINQDALPRFHMLWTLKEASLKCVGVGLSLFPNKFSVMNLLENKEIMINNIKVKGEVIIDGDYIISVVRSVK